MYNKYILKICQNYNWNFDSYAPECARVVSDDTCSDNLLPLEEYCALVTLPQHFQDKCPNGFLKYYNFTRFDPSFEYWSSTRKIDDVFIHTGSDSMYGKEFIAPNQKTDCFVILNGTALPKFCNESFHQICVTPKHSTSPIYFEPTENNLDMQLKFDRKRGKIYLNIYSPQSILQKLDDPTNDAVYCFTNADEVELKTPLKIKRVVSKEALNVYLLTFRYVHPGEYWCEAFDYTQKLIKSNTLIAYKKKKGYEYSLRVILKGICIDPEETSFYNFETSSKENCTVVSGAVIMNYLDKIKFVNNLYHVDVAIRVMKIFGKTGQDVDVILHLTTLRNVNIVGEFYKINGLLHSIPNITIMWFRSVDYCLPETTYVFGNIKLEWKLTPMHEDRSPDILCLNEKAIPHKRKCLGNFIVGAYWDYFNKTCNQNVAITEKTEELYNISIKSEISPIVFQQIANITSHIESIIPLDVYLIANIMNNVEHTNETDSSNTSVLDHVLGTIDHMITINKTVLKESQVELNATDSLLDSIEKYFDDDSKTSMQDILVKLNAGQEYLRVKPKFILHITRPYLSNVHGIGLYQSPNGLPFSEDLIKSIKIDQTFDDLDNLDDLELATYVPVELLDLIVEENGSKENITVITTIFYNDNLFNSEYEELGVPQSKVISVKIPDYGLYLDEPLPLLFRQNWNDSIEDIENYDEYENVSYIVEYNNTCAYWQYGEYAANKTGRWSNLGGSTETETEMFGNSTLTKCYFHHLTHFALLIMNQRIMVNESEAWNVLDIEDDFDFDFHHNLLSLITIIGSIPSLIGILGIFLTAICFSRWRQKTGSIILLQLSLTIMLEIIVIHVAGDAKLTVKTQLCTIVGICLHYVVLAKSSWMFVSAILQYYRFVKIFQVLPSRLILKAMIFSWGVPLIPVGLVAIFLPTYNAASRQFCYPADLALYFGLFLPVSLIVLSNLVVFILIMKNIFNPNVEIKPRTSYKNSTSQNKLQIYLGILLFFMLGLPWVFGILAEILAFPLRLICVYLFCLMGTLQGSVIFLFYVVLDRDTRNLWLTAYDKRFKKYDIK